MPVTYLPNHKSNYQTIANLNLHDGHLPLHWQGPTYRTIEGAEPMWGAGEGAAADPMNPGGEPLRLFQMDGTIT